MPDIDVDLYPLLRLILGLISTYAWARIVMLSYPYVRREGQTAATRLWMMTVVFLLASVATLLFLSALYTVLANPPRPQPIPLIIGVVIQTIVAVGGYVLVRNWPFPKDRAG